MALYFTPDFEIPITYTTRSGRTVQCECAIHVESGTGADVEPLRGWIREHDWSPFGQSVHDEAIQHPVQVHPDDVEHADPHVLESAAWSEALGHQLRRELPRDLIPDGFQMHVSGSCDGLLN